MNESHNQKKQKDFLSQDPTESSWVNEIAEFQKTQKNFLSQDPTELRWVDEIAEFQKTHSSLSESIIRAEKEQRPKTTMV